MDLKINYEETVKTGNEVIALAENFGELLGKIKSRNDELKTNWQGADAESYTSKITEQAEIMARLQKTINSAGEFLISAGKAYEEAMNSNMLG